MVARRLSVRKITEVIRLHHDHGLSARQIAKSPSIGLPESKECYVIKKQKASVILEGLRSKGFVS